MKISPCIQNLRFKTVYIRCKLTFCYAGFRLQLVWNKGYELIGGLVSVNQVAQSVQLHIYHPEVFDVKN